MRCVKERFAEDNVVIELNALKIAEDRTFADCARYILTTLLQLCLPAPAWVGHEYASLFPADVPDSGAKEGKLQLLTRFKKQLNKWQPLLRRFLTSEDDQVRTVVDISLLPLCSLSVGVSLITHSCAPPTPRLDYRQQFAYYCNAPASASECCAGVTTLCTAFQVELLLTMEEFCGEEGVFQLPPHLQGHQQGTGSSGAAFAPLFANLLQLLYDVDLVEEAAINAWAEEKQHADEDEKIFLNKVGGDLMGLSHMWCMQ